LPSVPDPGAFSKVVATAAEAIAGLSSAMSVAVGGFGLSGIPSDLIKAVLATDATDLRVASNNCGVDNAGLGLLLQERRISRVIASYVGENKEFERQFLTGELEVELVPQGSLAERLRAGGVGIPAFFTAAGAGTAVADGGMPWRYDGSGGIALGSPPKETREYDGRTYVLEEAIRCDFALVHAWKGDRLGNLLYKGSSRNFNPLCAMAGVITVAQVEHLVEPGEISPEDVHTPGVFVQRVLPLQPGFEKLIERRTVRPRPTTEAGS
jgi:3-oxoacid CoA-transferase subunit A